MGVFLLVDYFRLLFYIFVSIEAYILSFFVLYSTYLLVAVQRPLGDRGKRTIRLDVGYWRG